MLAAIKIYHTTMEKDALFEVAFEKFAVEQVGFGKSACLGNVLL